MKGIYIKCLEHFSQRKENAQKNMDLEKECPAEADARFLLAGV